MHVVGTVRVPIHFGRQRTSQDFIAVEYLGRPVLLGFPTQNKLGIVIDAKNKTVTFSIKGNQYVKSTLSYMNDNGRMTSYGLHMTEAITLPPFSEAKVPVHLSKKERMYLRTPSVFVESHMKCVNKHGVTA